MCHLLHTFVDYARDVVYVGELRGKGSPLSQGDHHIERPLASGSLAQPSYMFTR